ncbi:MAG: hypothetical protein IID35_07685 [Planctomycetes bacterium]|nr:hypothetical protein [Planctomycetota bacterium]
MSEPNDQQPSPITEQANVPLTEETSALPTESAAASLTQESIAVAVPPRYWWLKRLLIGGGVLLLALLVLRTWWGFVAQRRLDAQIAVYVARGEPIYPEDFDTEPIPDDQNAAKFLKDAAAALNLTMEQNDNVGQWYRHAEKVADHLDEIRKMVDAHAPALQLLRKARHAPLTNWDTKFRTPVMSTMLPFLSAQRMLAKFVWLGIVMKHQTGDDAAAVELLRDVTAQAKIMDRHPLLISHLVAIAIDALAVNAIESIAPQLTVESPENSPARSITPAKREQLLALIEDLVDDTAYASAGRLTTMGERMLQLNIFQTVWSGQASFGAMVFFGGVTPPSLLERVAKYPLGPLLQADALYAMKLLTPSADAIGRTDWAQLQASLPDDATPDSWIDAVVHPLSRIIIPSLGRVFLLHFRSLAGRKMAATALAIRLYEVDHGQRPKTLTQLVPDYLRELPVDPFASDGRALAYLPEAHPPILYSISQDAEDNGGTFTFRRKNGGVDREKLDLPFFLDGVRPKNKQHFQELARKSRDAREDHDYVEDEGGKSDEDQPR